MLTLIQVRRRQIIIGRETRGVEKRSLFMPNTEHPRFTSNDTHEIIGLNNAECDKHSPRETPWKGHQFPFLSRQKPILGWKFDLDTTMHTSTTLVNHCCQPAESLSLPCITSAKHSLCPSSISLFTVVLDNHESTGQNSTSPGWRIPESGIPRYRFLERRRYSTRCQYPRGWREVQTRWCHN